MGRQGEFLQKLLAVLVNEQPLLALARTLAWKFDDPNVF
jgi:hypothetical protein